MTLEKTEERKRSECRGDREREGGWNVPEKEREERVHSATKREEREGEFLLSEIYYGTLVHL